MHNQSSVWNAPSGFLRHAWDAEGLVGERPFWGRFWDLAALTDPQRALFVELRQSLRRDLNEFGTGPDRYGLIHADLVPENILVDGDSLQVIDFDDAGYGWHLFEIATSLYFIRRDSIYEQARDAVIEGYRQHRNARLTTTWRCCRCFSPPAARLISVGCTRARVNPRPRK